LSTGLKRVLEDDFLVYFSGQANQSLRIRRVNEFSELFSRLNACPRAAYVHSLSTCSSNPVNYIGFTAFLFPLALGLVILQRDLTRIEVVLRRGAYALAALLLVACVYGALSTPVQASTPVSSVSEPRMRSPMDRGGRTAARQTTHWTRGGSPLPPLPRILKTRNT